MNLYNDKDLKLSKTLEKLLIKCDNCGIIFSRTKKDIISAKKQKCNNQFCSLKCVGEAGSTKQKVTCKQCGINFPKCPSQIKISPNHFCNKSCAATYNNMHKTHGTRISKLEIWLSKKLSELYPLLEFHFNKKDAINSELDIYIPSLKLAFELNGIFHYEPIFGKEKLAQIENNDQRKFQACIENGIELCTIDVSKLKYFKNSNAQPYLNIISNLIDSKL